MSYYRHRRYRNWRYRSTKPTVYHTLYGLFGDAVNSIRKAFLSLGGDALEELLQDYGSLYGVSAERYARKTFIYWRSGSTKLSGQTMERLVELVPPYLSPEQRFELIQGVLKRHKPTKPYRVISVNGKEPEAGLKEIDTVLASMKQDDPLAFVPEKVMQAANWLYDEDITVARAMIAEAQNAENELIKKAAAREIELLKRTVRSGQLKAANYDVEMPAGKLSIVVFQPSRCFISTVCFGEAAPETNYLRQWRDFTLLNSNTGRNFIVWYYNHAETISIAIKNSKLLLLSSRLCLRMFIKLLKCQEGARK